MLQKQIGETVVKGLQEFVNPCIYIHHQKYTQDLLPKFRKDINLQMMEIEGLQPFNQGLYHNPLYEKLIQKIINTRKEYRASTDYQLRTSIAQQEYSFWKEYLKNRTIELPEKFQITDSTIHHLKESFEVACERNKTLLQVSKLPQMHFDHMRMYKFHVPIDNRCILQMIHFQMGYLLRLPRPISFEEIIRMYRTKIVATYEKSLGQDLLFQELCALAYWELYDTKEKGYMEPQEFADFMNIFKFNLEGDMKSFKREFAFGANLYQGELLSQKPNPQNDIVRWDFFRYLFLERNL